MPIHILITPIAIAPNGLFSKTVGMKRGLFPKTDANETGRHVTIPATKNNTPEKKYVLFRTIFEVISLVVICNSRLKTVEPYFDGHSVTFLTKGF